MGVYPEEDMTAFIDTHLRATEVKVLADDGLAREEHQFKAYIFSILPATSLLSWTIPNL